MAAHTNPKADFLQPALGASDPVSLLKEKIQHRKDTTTVLGMNEAVALIAGQFQASWDVADEDQKYELADIMQEEILANARAVQYAPNVFATQGYANAVAHLVMSFKSCADVSYIAEDISQDLRAESKKIIKMALQQMGANQLNHFVSAADTVLATAEAMHKPAIFKQPSKKETASMCLAERFNIAVETLQIQDKVVHYQTAAEALCTKFTLFYNETDIFEEKKDLVLEMASEIIRQSGNIQNESNADAVPVLGDTVVKMTEALTETFSGKFIAPVLAEDFNKKADALLKKADAQTGTQPRRVLVEAATKLTRLANSIK